MLNNDVLFIIDVSYNSSGKIIRNFIEKNINDCNNIAVFDNRFCFYPNKRELLSDIDSYQDEFFCSPAAFYDSIVGILSKARKIGFSEIVIYSPEADDCSHFFDNDSFDDYIYHYNTQHGKVFFEEYGTGYLSSCRKGDKDYSFISWIRSLC